MSDAISFRLPIRLVSVANLREHWSVKAKRSKFHRGAAYALTPAGLMPPLVVTITRVGLRAMDTDNLAISAKAVRDGIAQRIGVDDGSPLIVWRYAQRKGKRGEYAAEVEIREGTT